jgi:hypothetical protein
MAKTLAKLQARARKTSRKNAAATRVKPRAWPKQTFNVSHFRGKVRMAGVGGGYAGRSRFRYSRLTRTSHATSDAPRQRK